ncbi:MAG: O-antigen ligase family protein [Bryobacterales bacterium]|nr:O-antigen ligase family protein [Bryobacterales bacterium]
MPPTLRLGTIVQAACCVVPAAALLATGRPLWGGRCFFAALLTMLAFHLLRRNALSYTTLLLAVMPAMMFFRDFLFYSSIQALLLVCMLLWLVVWRERIVTLLTTPGTATLLVLATLYWLLSFIVTKDYTSNYRTFELAFAACAVVLLGHHRSHLATAFLGIGLTACTLGLGMLPFSTRLGMVDFEHLRLGNPIQIGNPCALVFLLTIVDGGALLGLRDHRWYKVILQVLTGIILLLTTSRGAWLIVLAGMAAVFIYDRARRKAILVPLGIIPILAIGLISFGHEGILLSYIDKTFSPDVTWAKRTTGRSDQWRALPSLIAESPVWGFGPGTGRDSAARFAGRRLLWHALYLQVIAETGLLGALICFSCLAALLRMGFRHRRWSGEMGPLIGVLGFLTIGISIPGIDGNAAMFLGLGLLSGCGWRVWLIRPALPHEVGQPAAAGCPAGGSGDGSELRAAPLHPPLSVMTDGRFPTGPIPQAGMGINLPLPAN